MSEKTWTILGAECKDMSFVDKLAQGVNLIMLHSLARNRGISNYFSPETAAKDKTWFTEEITYLQVFLGVPVPAPPDEEIRENDLLEEIRNIVSQKGNCKGCDSFYDTYGICYDKETNNCPKADQILSLTASHYTQRVKELEAQLKSSAPLSPISDTTKGAELIAAERQRQIEKEGWSTEHDKNHTSGSLAVFAASYILDAVSNYAQAHGSWLRDYKQTAERIMPFDREWFKPTPDDPIRQLTKAGALIAAEIDRLLAADRKSSGQG